MITKNFEMLFSEKHNTDQDNNREEKSNNKK